MGNTITLCCFHSRVSIFVLSLLSDIIVLLFFLTGYSPLHHAVQSDSVDCMRELIEAGADVNKGDGTSGRTPLHHAVIQSSIIATAELALRVSNR